MPDLPLPGMDWGDIGEALVRETAKPTTKQVEELRITIDRQIRDEYWERLGQDGDSLTVALTEAQAALLGELREKWEAAE